MSPKVTTDDSAGKNSPGKSSPGKNRPGRNRARFSAGQAAVRATAARIIRIVCAVLATILALGAVLVVLRNNINEQNSIVELITSTADSVSGPFSRDDGIFSFTGKNADSKNALLNWGIAAIVYLLVGRLLANAIAPKGAR